jgi:hypothetical protein
MSENAGSIFFQESGAYLPILEYVTSRSRRLQSSLWYMLSEYQGLFHSRQRLTGKINLIIQFHLFFMSEQLLWLLSNNLNNTHIWNTIQEKNEKNFGNSIWNIIIEIYLLIYKIPDSYNWLVAMKEIITDQNIKLLCIFLYGSVGMNWRYVYMVVLL